MNNLRKFINIFLIGSTAGMLCAHEKQILENEYVKADTILQRLQTCIDLIAALMAE